MKLDKNAINSLLATSDTQLWQLVRMLAAQSGAEVPETISPEDMKRLREVVSGVTDADLERAGQYLGEFGWKPRE